MASISYRNKRWQVRVRRKGHPTETRSFGTRQDAERWATGLEADMDRGANVPLGEAQRITQGDLTERYLVEVTPSLKGAKEDTIRPRALMRNPLYGYALIALTPSALPSTAKNVSGRCVRTLSSENLHASPRSSITPGGGGQSRKLVRGLTYRINELRQQRCKTAPRR